MQSDDPLTLPPLPKQQETVLEFLIEGLDVRQTAERMGLSTRTVEIHRKALFQRLGTNKATKAVAIYYKVKIAELEGEIFGLKHELKKKREAS